MLQTMPLTTLRKNTLRKNTICKKYATQILYVNNATQIYDSHDVYKVDTNNTLRKNTQDKSTLRKKATQKHEYDTV